MKLARAIALTAALAGTLLLTGCLATEYKTYRCTLNADGSGSGTITFQNIFSQDDDSADVSTSDFDELISEYLNGSKFEEENPRLHVTGKRLYEEKGELMGEVSYTFAHADSAGFILNAGCPVVFIPGVNSETVVESNGTMQQRGHAVHHLARRHHRSVVPGFVTDPTPPARARSPISIAPGKKAARQDNREPSLPPYLK